MGRKEGICLSRGFTDSPCLHQIEDILGEEAKELLYTPQTRPGRSLPDTISVCPVLNKLTSFSALFQPTPSFQSRELSPSNHGSLYQALLATISDFDCAISLVCTQSLALVRVAGYVKGSVDEKRANIAMN
ncbi:hypothetical protein BLNAU_24406 [Blattamonas nauphoetae]|uniref:Uncharacterized protein n=1 Tax=Blattamonas nauphoetae TaxID=2049346 RepID=A0ABQ9WNF8_9EUKA|nr:hypothetical protein BLNAU_24406 [Blattamonas nauphoetae]